MTDELDTSAPGSWSTCMDCPADDEARRLRTRLAEVEAERDAAWANAKERRAQVYEMRASAEKAEAALRLALPMMREDDWGADYGDGTERRDALYATLAALRKDEGGG